VAKMPEIVVVLVVLVLLLFDTKSDKYLKT